MHPSTRNAACAGERERAMTKQLCGNSMMMTMMHMCGMCMLCYGKMVIPFQRLPE